MTSSPKRPPWAESDEIIRKTKEESESKKGLFDSFPWKKTISAIVFLTFIFSGAYFIALPFFSGDAKPLSSNKNPTADNVPQNKAYGILSSIYPDVQKIEPTICDRVMATTTLPPSGAIIGCAKSGNEKALRRTAFVMKFIDGRPEAANSLLSGLAEEGHGWAASDKNSFPIERLEMDSPLAAAAVSCAATPELPQCGTYPAPPESDDDLSYARQLLDEGKPIASHFVAERAAFSGFEEANSMLCFNYLYGQGTSIDYDKALDKCSGIPAPSESDRINLAEAQRLKTIVDDMVSDKLDRKEIMLASHYKYHQYVSGTCRILMNGSACREETLFPIPQNVIQIKIESWPFSSESEFSRFATPLLN